MKKRKEKPPKSRSIPLLSTAPCPPEGPLYHEGAVAASDWGSFTPISGIASLPLTEEARNHRVPGGANQSFSQPTFSTASPIAIGLLSLSTSITRMTVSPLAGLISALAAAISVHFAVVMAVP